ncbi:uncharacterized protein LOC124164271 [Ischnura elegans]|uniref:uncharacterized protein LOC124164271 n=1 Tax=Ischnura elegans TaxID=197161 RepID=UPI001ED8B50A|nr:uncharacterized protein LOC124164271 [Ischnura elegans]
MSLRLDDFLSKKKEPSPVLDNSTTQITSKEDFEKFLDRLPEYRIRPEKVRPEDAKVRDKDFSFRSRKNKVLDNQQWKKSTSKSRDEGSSAERVWCPQGKKGKKDKGGSGFKAGQKTKDSKGQFPFANPVPPSMRSIRLEDLCSVPIHWKMLTDLRPKIKMEEEMFSKFVTMGKLHLQSVQHDKRQVYSARLGNSRMAGGGVIKRSKNRAGILETRALACTECGEEFCSGVECKIYSYDAYVRTLVVATPAAKEGEQKKREGEGEKKKGKKPKKRKRKKVPKSAD